MSELNIPDSWAVQSFSKVFQVNPRNKIENDNLEVSFVPMGSVNQYTAEIESEEVKEWGNVKKGYTHFQDGDVIFAKITPCMENKKSSLAKNLKNGFGSGSTEFHVLRPPKEILGVFVLHFVRSDFFLKDAANNMSGTAGQKRVPTTWLNDYPFPIPPIKEQERIVQKIESCFSRIEETEQNLNKVELLLVKYRESLLAKAFRGELIPQNPDDEPASLLLAKIREERAQNQKGKKKEQELSPISDEEMPFDIPESWEWARVSDLFNVMTGATPLKSNESYYKKKEVPYIKTGNVQNCLIFEANEFISRKAVEETNVKIFPKDTLLVAMYGEGKTRGQVGILKIEAGTNQACAALVNESLDYSIREYVFYWFLVQYEELRKKAEGGNQANLNLQKIKDVVIPFPPINELKNIIKKIKSNIDFLHGLENDVQSKFKILKLLRESILSCAFEGRLVEQIETEGTGHELLQNILEQKSQEVSAKESTKKKVAKKVTKKKTTKK
jgi:type I restriction enzyme S subunit